MQLSPFLFVLLYSFLRCVEYPLFISIVTRKQDVFPDNDNTEQLHEIGPTRLPWRRPPNDTVIVTKTRKRSSGSNIGHDQDSADLSNGSSTFCRCGDDRIRSTTAYGLSRPSLSLYALFIWFFGKLWFASDLCCLWMTCKWYNIQTTKKAEIHHSYRVIIERWKLTLPKIRLKNFCGYKMLVKSDSQKMIGYALSENIETIDWFHLRGRVDLVFRQVLLIVRKIGQIFSDKQSSHQWTIHTYASQLWFLRFF